MKPLVRWVAALFFTLSAFHPFLSHADSTQLLVTASNDFESTPTTLTLTLDADSNVKGMVVNSPSSGRKTFSVEDIRKGAAIVKNQGMEAVILKARAFEPGSGGKLILKFLTNGLTRTYATREIEIDREGTEWKLYANDQSGRRRFTRMHFTTTKFLGKVIGIQGVQFQ